MLGLIKEEGKNMNSEIISTEHLCLRHYKEEKDLSAMQRLLSDAAVNTFLPWFSLRTAEETAKFCRERFLEPYARGEIYHYVICEKDKEEPIGYLHIDGGESHNMGYGLAKEYWNRGYMSEAAAAAVERARQDGLPYLTATHDVNNPRSGSVMRRIGMKYVYSYEELWMPKRFPAIFRMYQLNLDGNADRVYWKYWDESAVHFVELMD